MQPQSGTTISVADLLQSPATTTETTSTTKTSRYDGDAAQSEEEPHSIPSPPVDDRDKDLDEVLCPGADIDDPEWYSPSIVVFEQRRTLHGDDDNVAGPQYQTAAATAARGCDSTEPENDDGPTQGFDWAGAAPIILRASPVGGSRRSLWVKSGSRGDKRERKGKKREPMQLFDSHTHVHMDKSSAGQRFLIKHPVHHVCTLGTELKEIPSLILMAQQARVHIGFGIHPWYAHRAPSDWLETLEGALVEHPTAIVGEIGIDKHAITKETGKCEFETQKVVFEQQWNLACKLHRPISVHCVQATGWLYEFIKASTQFPPAVAMHSYSGSLELATSLLRLPRFKNFFFGFSLVINAAHHNKYLTVIKGLPRDRILIESDVEDHSFAYSSVFTLCERISSSLGLSPNETAQLTWHNASRFLAF
ncbi:uba thif-type nad fad binding fold domain deoxiribonuclease [Pelomyxa schiedti]|nr:uba thif-type nad fad binding fold domain deoxiribonuclease [Pelomyxa schiedti]